MERDQRNQQENPSVISHFNVKEESSPRKLLAGAGGGGSGGDRLKRDEWSEGAVSSLLEAYESKWILRNRAKLKGQDWEDVARHVSSRGNSTKSPKTQTQCKNKIESMKKRYRSEAASGGDHASSWPLFSRLDHLLRGTGGTGGSGGCSGVGGVPALPTPPTALPSPLPVGSTKNTPVVLVESLPPPQPPPPPPAPPPPPPPRSLTVETAQNSPKSNGAEQVDKEERAIGEEAKLSDQVSDRDKKSLAMDTDSSTPALYGSKDNRSKLNSRVKTMDKRKRRRMNSREDVEMGLAQSIQWLAEAVVRAEQARMETMRELERMRVEAEARRGEMDLKRTEIIANTQLEIARIFAACASSGGKNGDSCTGIRNNCQ